MIVQTNRMSKRCSAAAHAANVDEVAEVEPDDPDCEPEQGTSETNPQDPDEQKVSSQDADSKKTWNMNCSHRLTT